jgi:para-nitrobenzyl esterase
MQVMSEDCLFLNVWVPENAKKAPVFLWIHGGALLNGAAHESTYDGARMASRGFVVVSINYRLGALGYLAHPALSAESPLKISGNYGSSTRSRRCVGSGATSARSVAMPGT